MSPLGRIATLIDPALRAYAVRSPERPRFAGSGLDEERELVLEAVYEGYLLHYREPRCFAGMDDDLRLLSGDALYALGLERLAQRGLLAEVAELSDLITLCARAEAEGRGDLVEGLWEASAAALGGRGQGARATARDWLAG